ncbi:MAG: hypothetical protein RLZZ84_1361 [Pseudomonadota bacterium]
MRTLLAPLRLFPLTQFLLVLLMAAALPARLSADPADITAASRSVVRVALVWVNRSGAGLVGHGSGFAVAPDLVVTNAHVIAPMADDDTIRVLIIPAQGSRGMSAKVIAYSPRNDLALLRIQGGKLPAVTLSPAGAADGAPVYALGYPGSVDLAQGFDAVDMITPTAPVKTQGTVSAGRSSKSFATVLHTASIGAGNSGGPLMDACGRVIGVNSFGTVSDGSDAEFFFAVAMPEVVRFLRENHVTAHLSPLPCQSMDDFARAQAALAAGDKARSDDAARSADDQRKAAEAKAGRTAELQILAQRENGLALAGVALMLALIAGGAMLWAHAQHNHRQRKVAAIACALLLAGALYAWFSRPGIEAIETRAQELAAAALPAATPGSAPLPAPAAGSFKCVLDPARSRVTVSDISDVPLNWGADGCVNARSQYGLGADGWSRVLVPNGEDTVTVARFDPASATYSTGRFLLDAETMAKARAARAQYEPPQCGGGESGARRLGDSQAAVLALLPAQANEQLVYKCSPAP